ncbi:MAG: DUF4011 domain-containing protein [Verrucomicrobiaceae bacterium]|nr:MAG: DUF4011 domain-containing protein [Verrucomicrobiaceae bacterium]
MGMILEAMLQRLYASLVSGPSMNARPHRSRQRCDLMELADFQGTPPATALKELLENRKLEFPAKVPTFENPPFPIAEWSDEQKAAQTASLKQTRLLKKLREIVEDARDYLNDHGESCLALGFPLVSLPPSGEEKGSKSSRILAPLLLMPVDLQVRTSSRPGVTLSTTGEGADLLIPNPALMAWIERQTGKGLDETFSDETASDPWREISELLSSISSLLALDPAAEITPEIPLEAVPLLESLPKGAKVLSGAVLGLFPLSNQSLLRDTRWMLENQKDLTDPVASFLSPLALQGEVEETPAEEAVVTIQNRNFAEEWLVSNADPCQANAVLASREAKVLVVHGPPGTGKSQTIMNMIADHLARGERILFVCDKRTALDVVKYRLDAAGLGHLCGVVHDPGADRKDFYMGLRAQLENLADIPVPQDPRSQLDSLNRQLSGIHAELEGYRRKLHGTGEGGVASFHELLGEWLRFSLREDLPEIAAAPSVTRGDLETSGASLDEIARRAQRANYGSHPFRDLLGLSVADWLELSPAEVKVWLQKFHEAATAADALRIGEMTLDPELPFATQEQSRKEAAVTLRSLVANPEKSSGITAAQLPETRVAKFRTEMDAAQPWITQISGTSLDAGLASGARAAGVLNLATVNRHLASLGAWEPVAGSFLKQLFAGSVKKEATDAVAPLGLVLKTGWQDALKFYQSARTRLMLAELLERITSGAGAVLPDDDELLSRHAAISDGWKAVGQLKAIDPSADFPQDPAATAGRLEAEAARAGSLAALTEVLSHSKWFSATGLASLRRRWAGGESAVETATAWEARAATIEDVVRLESNLVRLPTSIEPGARQMAVGEISGELVLATFERVCLENTLRQKLKDDPELAAIDGDRIEASFALFHDLSSKKKQFVRDYIQYLWATHQRQELLAMTGSQLNKRGAALRSRLYVRGKKALKLRQMLATGIDDEKGDPIFSLCPVWMASPSTVAQIFPRQSIFDVVIFDEASQCRLEEALPVLLRGKRVVIAGDQKQLPPTRFFEQALSDSGDSEAETAEELFHQQQSDAEDLLSAALNIDVKEAYLDVHYRSRNEALIGFSNQNYYGARLQPIPGHPRNKALSTPIRIHRVDGVYDQRANVKEAETAATLVAELLAEKEPPSIGVACFNLTQREAILEALSALADKDAVFATNLETARQRKGRDSFEGLFVKNLENVQGDERDVMIICTTFGPDPQGKFRRNFGVLSQREGGRRLNVLVTRARDAIHVLTSIPVTEYTALSEEVPPGQVPNGRLQLYGYLRYAEQLTRWFDDYQSELEKMRRDAVPEKKVWPSATPSRLADSLASALLEKHATGTQVHWGNDGFSVDVACTHPLFPADVTVGVLTDFSRFHKTPDPIEWDLFRTTVLRDQGWELERLWSPVIFRRHGEMLERIRDSHARMVEPGKSGSGESVKS